MEGFIILTGLFLFFCKPERLRSGAWGKKWNHKNVRNSAYFCGFMTVFYIAIGIFAVAAPTHLQNPPLAAILGFITLFFLPCAFFGYKHYTYSKAYFKALREEF